MLILCGFGISSYVTIRLYLDSTVIPLPAKIFQT